MTIKKITNRNVKYAIYILIIALARIVRMVIAGENARGIIHTTITYSMGLFLILVMWGFVARKEKKTNQIKVSYIKKLVSDFFLQVSLVYILEANSTT